MNEFKIDDTFFKNGIDYKDLDESIYTQFAKTMAKNVDIDLAKTPLVDILTGYTRYRILQFKIDKAIEYIDKHFQDDEGIVCKITGEYVAERNENFIKEILDILKENKI